ncbi:hypothetical protein M9H77_19149 [Catharanthus roseus]|uniref:Uncharacterized protein n=1 Tax=Catharanthus roseus TaxID=4058 RepID=A0ACC0B9H4_CATRO|nr:hypothetical protein M9H77_19149 [Catharanthus roseus]
MIGFLIFFINFFCKGLDIPVFSYVCTSGESGSEEHRRPANNRVVKNVFIEALWLEAPSHLLTSTWTSIPAIPPSRCTDDYMPWFLPRTHPQIQNSDRLPSGVQLPTISPITLDVLLDIVARELDHDDIDEATKCCVTWLM